MRFDYQSCAMSLAESETGRYVCTVCVHTTARLLLSFFMNIVYPSLYLITIFPMSLSHVSVMFTNTV